MFTTDHSGLEFCKKGFPRENIILVQPTPGKVSTWCMNKKPENLVLKVFTEISSHEILDGISEHTLSKLLAVVGSIILLNLIWRFGRFQQNHQF